MKLLVLKCIGLVLFALALLLVLPIMISAADWLLFIGGIVVAIASIFIIWAALENINKHLNRLKKAPLNLDKKETQ